MRKGQAALEFLTTYGWAFIVILVMIGALAYFGVLSPSKVTPSRCIIESGFSCEDFKITTTGIDISLVNGRGEGLTINYVNVTSDVVTLGACTSPAINPAPGSNIPDAGTITITCPLAVAGSLDSSKGDKVKFEFSVNYKMAKGTYNQTFGGSIYGAVQ